MSKFIEQARQLVDTTMDRVSGLNISPTKRKSVLSAVAEKARAVNKLYEQPVLSGEDVRRRIAEKTTLKGMKELAFNELIKNSSSPRAMRRAVRLVNRVAEERIPHIRNGRK